MEVLDVDFWKIAVLEEAALIPFEVRLTFVNMPIPKMVCSAKFAATSAELAAASILKEK